MERSVRERIRTLDLLIRSQTLYPAELRVQNKNGCNRARTYDPLLVRQMLSQLSYTPATQKGLEPSTSGVTGQRSNQLSY